MAATSDADPLRLEGLQTLEVILRSIVRNHVSIVPCAFGRLVMMLVVK